MNTRNIRRKFTRADGIFLACLLAMFGGILLYNANKQAEGFITVAHDDPERFVNSENILIKRVHEEHWDIFYRFDADCPDSRKTEENHRLLRESLEWGIRTWLAPLREITDRPIVDKFIFHQGEGQHDEYEIAATFGCEKRQSTAHRSSRSVDINEHQGRGVSFENLPYGRFRFVLLHELGHVFDLADTYVGNLMFSPPSTGGLPKTIGSQPGSVMSIDGGCRSISLCLDDKRAIQWLYRYHWEGLDPTNCPPEFVYEELTHEGRTVGGCVYKQPLFTYVRHGEGDMARRLLESNQDIKINDKDKHGYTALYYIATIPPKPTVGLLKEILKYPGIDVNITDKYGNSPLHWGAWLGQWRMVYWLLFTTGHSEITQNEGILLNSQNNYGETALHYAAKLGEVRCTSDLLNHTDIKPNIKDSRFGNTPLHEAAKNGHTEIVKALLAHQDINPNLRNDAGFTPLQLAMQGGAVAAADSDASFQAQHPELWVSLPEEHRQQLLESSRLSPAELQRARAEIVALLRAYPVLPGIRQLILAVGPGGNSTEVLSVLRSDPNIEINYQDKDGNTALHLMSVSSWRASPEVLQAYLTYPKADINIKNKSGNTPLHVAAWFGNHRTVSLLTEDARTKVNVQNKYGIAPLHYAARQYPSGSKPGVSAKPLLDRQDIDVNIKDKWGNTPLHYAAKFWQTQSVRMLLAHKDINPNLRNADGFTPSQLAMQPGFVASRAVAHEIDEDFRVLNSGARPNFGDWRSEAREETVALLRAHPGIILPEASDVNGDGVVNIQDLVWVSGAFGQ